MIKFIAPYNIKNIEPCNLDECLAFLSLQSIIGIDVEATGLDPFSSKIIMLQIGTQDVQYVIDCRVIDVSCLFPIITSNKIRKLGANLKFDYKMILSNWGIRMQGIQDAQVSEKVLCTGLGLRGFSLKTIAEKYTNIQLDKDDRLEFTLIKKERFNERQVKYGAMDVEILFHIWKCQEEKLIDAALIRTDYLEQKFVRVIAEMEYNGMPVDTKRWLELAEENELNMYKALDALTEWIIENKKYKYLSSPDLFTGKVSCVINWNSPAQVAKIFIEEGIPVEVLDEDKSEELSELLDRTIEVYKFETGKVELEKWKDNELVSKFLLYKKYQKAVNTYGKEWLAKFINPITGRVHTSFDQIKNTGRVGSFGPNVQQIPSFKSAHRLSCEAHRTCFVAQEGWKFAVRDLSGCELRILADYSGEESMIHEFTQGTGDLHSLTSSKVFKTEVNKKKNAHLRQIGKTLNFAIGYGASGYKISKQIGVSREEGDEIVENFYKAFPSLKEYFKVWHRFIKDTGYLILDNYIQRRMYFPFYEEYKELKDKIELSKIVGETGKEHRKALSRFMSLKGTMERVAQNYRIQSSNATMVKIAMCLLYDYLLENDLFDSCRIILLLHDEIVLEAKESIVDEMDKVLSNFMIQAGKLLCPNVPMEVDGGVSKIWEH